MKKLVSLILAAMLILSFSLTAAAATPLPAEGTITINGLVQDSETVYSVYRLLDLESYDVTAKAYSYTVNADWAGFFQTSDALAYFSIDASGYVTWREGVSESGAAELAKKALAYAKANGIAPVQTSETDGTMVITTNPETNIVSGKFSNLPMGYYLVDSTVGALCGLTTTNPHASINAKNGIPTIEKQVKEDSTNSWGASNTADIGQDVEFRTTISVHPGAEKYVLHDHLSDGLTYKGIVKIEHTVPGTSGAAGSTTELVLGTDYTVSTTATCGVECSFEVTFSDEFCNRLAANDKIVVYYTTMLNRNAVIAGEGNPNDTWLEFGDDHWTEHDNTNTYSFGFDIVKTDSQNTLINGAEFRIYDALTGGNEVAVVLMDDGVTYRRARADETGVPIVVKDGKVRVVGFDNGVYYAEETVAPAGYNKLAARQPFTISDSNLDSIFNDGIYSTGSGVHIVNKSGSMLPETGAMGTMLFVTFGTMAVLAAGVLLVTKKRMSMIED